MSDRTGMAPGLIDGPEYFVHGLTGHIILPPGDSQDRDTLRIAVRRIQQDPRYRDYQYHKVHNLKELDELTERMVSQEKRSLEAEAHHEERALAEWERQFKDRIYTRLASSSTSEFEKEFLRLYMKLRDPKKKERYRQRFLEFKAFFVQREYDNAHTLSDNTLKR